MNINNKKLILSVYLYLYLHYFSVSIGPGTRHNTKNNAHVHDEKWTSTLTVIAGFQFIHVHFIRNISGKNPHKHLAHKVINNDSGIDLNTWVKHFLKRNERRMWNLDVSSDTVDSEQCVRWQGCVTSQLTSEGGDTPPSTVWLHHNVRYLHLDLCHQCSRSLWLIVIVVIVNLRKGVRSCRLLPNMKQARVLLAHVSWHCNSLPTNP